MACEAGLELTDLPQPPYSWIMVVIYHAQLFFLSFFFLIEKRNSWSLFKVLSYHNCSVYQWNHLVKQKDGWKT